MHCTPLQTPENYLNSFGLKCTPKTPSLLASDWLTKKLHNPSIFRRVGFGQFLGCKKVQKPNTFRRTGDCVNFWVAKKVHN